MNFSFPKIVSAPTFEAFDLVNGDLSTLEIVEKAGGGNCFVRSRDTHHYYNAFILEKNSRSITVCEVTFYPTSTTKQYIPRLTFRKTKQDGTDQTSQRESVIISFSEGKQSQRFWDLIGFLGSFKHLVDTDDFKRRFQVVSQDYATLLHTLDSHEKIEAVRALIRENRFSYSDIMSMAFETRRTALRYFIRLIKDSKLPGGKTMREWYKAKYSLHGDEAVWHHFLKRNPWIIGLNTNLQFISDLIDEPKVGVEDSHGTGSPKVDMLGIANYTTLIELKTSDTPIFKSNRGAGSRANTWEFSSEFISGISQCLGQKQSFDESYAIKTIVDDEGNIISKDEVFSADVKTIFIVGCRYKEFPHNRDQVTLTKSKTFELFRRNNRNIDIITYDELFERAYHIVFSDKLANNWFTDDNFDIKTDITKQ